MSSNRTAGRSPSSRAAATISSAKLVMPLFSLVELSGCLPLWGRFTRGSLAAQFLARQRELVHLVGTVGQTKRTQVRPHAGQREIVGNAAAAVDLDRPVDDPQRDLRHGELDPGDLDAGMLVADGVHQPG